MRRAVDAIRDGRVSTTEEGHLLLPEGVKWPCATNNVLFVRYFYKPLFDDVLRRGELVEASEDPRGHRYVLTGQPGTGKSVFG